ncbi:MAG: hypothetical protein J6S24_08795 [Lentisphaeria bacterium]|nr:hypothetical protein [Lentisphaeria bacterium]
MNARIENGVWIRVADLDAASRFYREVLQLPPPVMECQDCCVFLLEEQGFKLVLEHSGAEYLEHAGTASSWIVSCSDIDGVEKRLSKFGIELFRNMNSFGDCRYHRACDPEGNPFIICERAE